MLRRFTNLLSLIALLVAVGCQTENTGNEPQPEPEQSDLFEFKNIATSRDTFTVDIIPQDKESEYIVMFAKREYFETNKIDTVEELIEDDYQYLSDMSSDANLSIRDFASNAGWLVSGDRLGYSGGGLYPDTEYVVYCYGIELSDSDYVATTDLYYTAIKTTGPAMQSVEFDIECNVDGNVVDITINPNDYDGFYYYCVVAEGERLYLSEDEPVSERYREKLSNMTFDIFNQWINVDGIPSNLFCLKGTESINLRVEPSTNYMVAVFALSEEQLPLLCSMPTVAHFTTEEYAKSELTLDLQVVDITPYNAVLNVYPSNNNESYACLLLAASQAPLADTEYQLMKSLISGFMPATFEGPIEGENLTPLMPDTEYVVYAFGIDSEQPTTDLYEVRFTTVAATEGATEITDFKLLKLFDSSEIIELDPSYQNKLGDCECVAIVEATTNVPCDKLYFWWYEEWMKVEYSEEAFLEDLLMYPYANNPEIMDMYYSKSRDDLFFFAGIAEDEEGNLSDIYYGDSFEIKKDMTDPAEEFFQYVNSDAKAEPSTLNIGVVGIRR